MKLRVVFVVFGLLAATIGIPSPVVAQAASWDSEVSASSPSHWWKLDAAGEFEPPAIDSAGNIAAFHHPDATGTVGVSGNAALFGAGTSPHLKLDGTNTKFDQLTAELWFKPGTGSNVGRQRLIRHRTSGYSIDWIPNTSSVLANVALEKPDGSTWQNVEVGAIGVDPNEWHHVALTVSATTVELWVDGLQRDVFIFDPANAVGVVYSGDLLTLGSDHEGSQTRRYTGAIDEVVLYDRPLTGTEIENHFTSTGRVITPPTTTINASQYAAAVTASSPIAYWQLDEASTATVIADTVDPASNNAGISGNRPTFGVDGAFGGSTAINFANRYQYLTLPENLATELADEATVEFWFNSSHNSGRGRFIRSRTSGFGIDWLGADQEVEAWVHTNQGSATVRSEPLSYNKWHHVAMTFNGDQLDLIINGELQDVAGLPAGSSINIGSQFTVANDYPNYRKRGYVGAIDELAIYNQALPTTEIRNHYTPPPGVWRRSHSTATK